MLFEEEIFEFNDFSTSSDWERFISDLEEILTQWNLVYNAQHPLVLAQNDDFVENVLKSDNQVKCSSKLFADPQYWFQQEDTLKFGKVTFQLTYFSFENPGFHLKQIDSERMKIVDAICCRGWDDMNSTENDWAASGHPLVRYYGLSQFLILSPLNNETISTEDRARLLIGSASVALHHTDCQVPFFVQLSNLNRRLFMGVMQICNGFRTYFDMIQLPDVPLSYRYLNELVELFKKKLFLSFSYQNQSVYQVQENQTENETWPQFSALRSDSSVSTKVSVSIRFTYILSKWPTQYLLFSGQPSYASLSFFKQFSYFDSTFSTHDIILKPLNNFYYQKSLFGDPLKQIQLATTWPSVAEELITDNAYHSDLQPRLAPRWSLRVLFHDFSITNPFCRTIDSLRMLSQFRQISQQLNSFIRKIPDFESNQPVKDGEEKNVRMAFDRLTSSSLINTSASNTIANTTNQLFSQLKTSLVMTNSFQIENLKDIIKLVFEQDESMDQPQEKKEHLNHLKSAPIKSLTWRIGMACINVYAQSKQTESLAQMWKFFVDQLRNHWEESRLLPHLHSEIDLSCCIFHQKLQMLNCCIEQKIKREKTEPFDKSREKKPSDDSDDEFFDADEDFDGDNGNGESIKFNQAEGRSDQILLSPQDETVYLVKNPSQPIYIPLTQNSSPMTEDMLAKQISSLALIEDPKLKIRLQSAGLVSDMEAFKASNPGSQFEDFIRWHSPRDWIELEKTEQGEKAKFGLSRRMRESTTWIDLWNMAKPCPIKRQKRLFNYTKEAEEILQSFENLSIGSFVDLIVPIVGKSAIERVIHCQNEIISLVAQNCPDYSDGFELFLFSDRQSSIEQHFLVKNLDSLTNELLEIEYQIIKFHSTLKKFVNAYEFYTKKSFVDLFENQTTPNFDTPPQQQQPKQSKKLLMTSKFAKLGFGEFRKEELIKIIVRLLTEPEVEFSNKNPLAELVVQMFSDSDRFQYEQSTSVGDRLPSNDQGDNFDDEQLSATKQDNQKISKTPVITMVNLPTPIGREFIIRAPSIQRPSPYSRPSSHRMYALLSEQRDFRIASAFTEDTAYF